MPNSCTVLSEAPAMREDAAPVLSAGSLPLAVVLNSRTMLLFGWLASAPPETATVLDFGLLCPGLDLHEAAVASFERSDLLSTARGLVAFMKTARDVDPNTLSRLYFKSQGTYYHLDVVDNRLVLEDRQAIAQLKDMIGRLRGPVTAVRALKRVCRPRFGGHETVSALAAPVRLAQDTALYAPGAGVFVSGWLLDPCRAVCLVLLKSTRSFYARLDQTWVRLPRPDVTQAFAGNPMFADHLRPWEQQHGFITFVPRPQPVHPDEVFYLEIVMDDESCAFLPLKFSDGDRQMMLRQILGGVNEGDPAIDRIVATHLGPLVAALSSDLTSQVATVTASFGSTVKSPVLSIVIPLPQVECAPSSGQIEGGELTGYAGPLEEEGRWPSTVVTASSSSGRWHRSTWPGTPFMGSPSVTTSRAT